MDMRHYDTVAHGVGASMLRLLIISAHANAAFYSLTSLTKTWVIQTLTLLALVVPTRLLCKWYLPLRPVQISLHLLQLSYVLTSLHHKNQRFTINHIFRLKLHK